jgi:N-acetyl-anhydromuramyl-L-alanine amidase AmpD
MALKRVWIPSPNYSSRGGSGVRLVVIHTAEGARSFDDLGGFFASSSAGASSHVGIDDQPGRIGEYVKRDQKAWTQANYNPQAVSVELCAAPINSSYPCGANWTGQEWNQHKGMLENLADWIREECQHYGLPIVKLTASEAQSSGRGVCGHVDLGAGGGGHWDPGPNFPWPRVIDLAKGNPTEQDEEGNMIGASLAANGALHVFQADGTKLGYTWQKAGDTNWQGGNGTPATFKQFATAPAKITGVSAALADNGNLHVFVKCANGKTYYTWQRKGATDWHGGQAGKTVAGLSPFA